MKILKVKDWKSKQFSWINPNVIHLHKCNRFITLGARYISYCDGDSESLHRRIFFIDGHENGIGISYRIVNKEETTVYRGIVEANRIEYIIEAYHIS